MGRRVVVIGAGNTGIDAARAARRLGAEVVQILYRRGQQQMAAFRFEYEQAREEGVDFRWWAQPVAVHQSAEDDSVVSVECVATELLADGTLGTVGNSKYFIECDAVITAIGQSPLLAFLESCRGVKVEQGRVVVERVTGQTGNPRYFAGGDCVNGGREVVDAVADGKRSAAAIARLLEASHA